MQRIIQQTTNDCGVACVAMLIQRYAGHTAETAYRDAREVMLGTMATRITNVAAIRRALRHFGIEIG
uniref:cysteine peptidase family C39 domain-containing protein n=1 Tax=Zoogloea ramigera TaxID=350 RepID=UPI003FA20D41